MVKLACESEDYSGNQLIDDEYLRSRHGFADADLVQVSSVHSWLVGSAGLRGSIRSRNPDPAPYRTTAHPTPPHHTTPYHIIPHSTTLHHTIPHSTAPHHTTPHQTKPYHTTPHHTIPYHTTTHHATPHHTTSHHQLESIASRGHRRNSRLLPQLLPFTGVPLAQGL